MVLKVAVMNNDNEIPDIAESIPWIEDDDLIEPDWLTEEREEEWLGLVQQSLARVRTLPAPDDEVWATITEIHPSGKWHLVYAYDYQRWHDKRTLVREVARG